MESPRAPFHSRSFGKIYNSPFPRDLLAFPSDHVLSTPPRTDSPFEEGFDPFIPNSFTLNQTLPMPEPNWVYDFQASTLQSLDFSLIPIRILLRQAQSIYVPIMASNPLPRLHLRRSLRRGQDLDFPPSFMELTCSNSRGRPFKTNRIPKTALKSKQAPTTVINPRKVSKKGYTTKIV